jgi:hypothetical protein
MNGPLLRTLLPLLAIGAALLAPTAADAGRTQRSIFEDDSRLLYSGPDGRDAALDQIAALGADEIHVQVRWDKLAPAVGAAHKPSFDATDPAAYPAGAWDALDGLVRGAKSRHLGVLLTLTGPGPRWAAGCRAKGHAGMCKPSVKQFAAFVRAAGRRYSGHYLGLPRITRWSLWNEPNLYRWLYPQLVRHKGRLAYFGAARYRSLFRAGAAALHATGHARDSILLGEASPVGNGGSALGARTIPPATFLRTVLCIDAKGHRLKGRAAQAAYCTRKFAKLPATGIAHHPYTPAASCSPRCKGGPSDITIASLGRLVTLVNQAGRAGRIRRHAPIELTEFGFQSDPPDKFSGISLTQQARYINWADFLAFRVPQIASVAQYTLYDDARGDTFETGLRRAGGKPKPSLAAYRMPIFVISGGAARVKVFGGARPHGGARRVSIQHKATRKGRWHTVAKVTRNSAGYLYRSVKGRGGYWRLSWASGRGTLRSRTARVDRP